MTSSGFIYVLVNPSMGSLVKIGKTQRNPEERVSELSSATGVPTPFYLAYHEYFNDCDKAETYIHERLSPNRVSQTREFFNVSLNVVIRLINEAKTSLNAEKNQNSTILGDETSQYAPVETLSNAVNPYNELYWLASDYLIGSGKALQDAVKAISLYERAASTGCTSAFFTLGNIFSQEIYTKKNLRKAIDYYEQGIAYGDNRCWAEMAGVYLRFEDLKNFNNWEKCWANYFSSDDFFQNIEHTNSVDFTSNTTYSFSYICEISSWLWSGRNLDVKRYLSPIINNIRTRNNRAYGEEVIRMCQNAINPQYGKRLNQFYGVVVKELSRILEQEPSENEKAQSADITSKKSIWSRIFGKR